MTRMLSSYCYSSGNGKSTLITSSARHNLLHGTRAAVVAVQSDVRTASASLPSHGRLAHHICPSAGSGKARISLITQASLSKHAWLARDQRLCDAVLVLIPVIADSCKAKIDVQPIVFDDIDWHTVMDFPGRVFFPVYRTILAGHSKRMKDAMFKDEVASKLKKGIVCSSMLLVASIEEGLVDAAKAVVQLMYEGVVPTTLSAADLVKMCRVADHWEAEDCLISCLKRLIQLPDKDLGCAQLAQLLPQLPASIRQLPQYKEWEQKLMQILVASAKASTALDASSAYLLVYLFADVHSLLTSQPQLKCFRQLPFHAVKAWAASDNLVVDSENSVVIALSSWIKAAGDCSTEQQKELSSLIRVKHLTPGFMIYKLPELDWFQHDCEPVEDVFMAFLAGITAACSNIPEAWLLPPRKQLPAGELAKRATISWDIPEVKLAELFVKGGCLRSPPIYLAGTGVEIHAQFSKGDKTGQYTLGVYLCPAGYTVQGAELAATDSGKLSCTCTLQRLVPTASKPVDITTFTAAVGTGCWGSGSVLTASEPSCLKPHLVDGCLKLRAQISRIM